MQVRRGKAPVGGTHLAYEVAGEGEWMVLAHGGAGTRVHWWQQVAAFQSHYRCVTYDARGFGQSPPGEVPSGGDVFVDDLVGLLDHLGLERTILIGHSMGGLPVSGVAQTQPHRVRGLVMSDTAFGFATKALARWAAQMLEQVTSGFEVLDHVYAAGFAERRPDLHYLYGALNRLNERGTGPQGTATYQAWSTRSAVDYSSFEVPSLFIVGTEDELTVPWLIKETVAAVRGAQLVEIEGAGHSGYAERADVFNDAVLRFCRSLP